MTEIEKINKAIEQSEFEGFWHADESEANIKAEFGEEIWRQVYLIFTDAVNDQHWSELKPDACRISYQYLTERYPYLSDLAKSKVIDLGVRFWHYEE